LLKLALGAEDLRLQRLVVGERRVDGRLLAGGPAEQGLRAAQSDLGILQLRLELRDGCLLDLDVRLEGSLFEPVEQVALLDFHALGEETLIEERANAGDEVDAAGRLDAADIFGRLGDRLTRCGNDADGGWRRRRLLCSAWRADEEAQYQTCQYRGVRRKYAAVCSAWNGRSPGPAAAFRLFHGRTGVVGFTLRHAA
jgi:hypothetical protein